MTDTADRIVAHIARLIGAAPEAEGDAPRYTHRVIVAATGTQFALATSEAQGHELIAEHTATRALMGMDLSKALPLIVVPRMTLKRAREVTTVSVDGLRVATITRRTGSNSSPRGGAYRYFYYVRMLDGTTFNADYTRKEALETIERELARRTKS